MRRSTAKWTLTLAVLLWMAVIWWFSSKPADVSTETRYAVSDEIHQYFVPGRSCQVSDMVLDSAGVLAGVAVVWAVWRLLRPQRKDG